MDRVIFGNISLPAEIALSNKEKALGLMNRNWPPPVMVFPFDKSAYRKFWMKETQSPLDVIFCNANRVIAIEHGEPLSLVEFGPNKMCNLVVELPRGKANIIGIVLNTSVKVEYSLSTLARKFELTLTT